MKILVVDDEELLVKGIRFNLQNEGYDVCTGSNGLEALELAQKENPDLIVLDEPFVGLDPNASYFLTNELQRRADKGAKIIYSTHVLEVAEKICNRVVLIDEGQVKVNGLMKDVVANESLGELFRRVTTHE